MALRVAINGYGRIGRCILRAMLARKSDLNDLAVVAINDLMSLEQIAHLTKYDSTHGALSVPVDVDASKLIVEEQSIQTFRCKNPNELPWEELGIDVVLECSGLFTDRESAGQHLQAGAGKVLISAPATGVDATVVFGINHRDIKPEHRVISNASCTTNCLAPLVKSLNQCIGVNSGLLNTVHAYTSDQCLLDGAHKDLRRARAAGYSIIPTSTGAARAVGLVLPEMAGKLDGFATRVPTLNVSLVDLTFKACRSTSVDEVNHCLRRAVEEDVYGILQINELPLTSCDFNHNPASSIFDLTQTLVIDDLVKVVAWYDNEWGFANRMLDVTCCLGEVA